MPSNETGLLLLLGAIVAALGIAGLVLLHRITGATGLAILNRPRATIVASDTGAGVPTTIRDPALGLRGRPDYLLEERNRHHRLIPVELKPNRRSARLYESDRIQLAAYLVALHGSLPDQAAEYGYVRYASGTFRVDLSRDLETRVETIVSAIRAGRESQVVHRSHANPALCARCALRGSCDEALA